MPRSQRGAAGAVLYVLRVPGTRPPELVEAWDPGVPGVDEVFHARFVDHVYPPHTHTSWTVLIVDYGTVRYALDRHDHGAVRSTVTVLPPHVTHDGRAGDAGGFVKRVVYLTPEVVGDHLIGRAVDAPTIDDVALVGGVRALHRSLRGTVDALEAETRVALVAERLTGHLSGRTPDAATAAGRGPRKGGGSPGSSPAGAVRDLLDADPCARRSLRSLAAQVGVSPTHLVRCFTSAYGLPPHAYLVGRRVAAARRLLLDGRAPAEVAVAAGFHDQAHLSRHFRRHVCTTPGRYRTPPGVRDERSWTGQ